MWPSRFAETADECRVGSFKEPQRSLQPGMPGELGINGGKLLQAFSLANIGDERYFCRFVFGFPTEFVEFADQVYRQVINAEVSPVLERPEESAFSRAAETGDD